MCSPLGSARSGGGDWGQVRRRRRPEEAKLQRDDRNILFFCNAVAAHALTRIAELRQHILRRDVACAHDADAERNRRAVAAKPSPRRCKHVGQGEGGRSAANELASAERKKGGLQRQSLAGR